MLAVVVARHGHGLIVGVQLIEWAPQRIAGHDRHKAYLAMVLVGVLAEALYLDERGSHTPVTCGTVWREQIYRALALIPEP